MQDKTAELVQEARDWATLLRQMDGEPVQLIMLPGAAQMFEDMADELERLSASVTQVTQ